MYAKFRRSLVFALVVTLSAAAGAASSPPVIGKPRPAPPMQPNLMPLPPASIDNSLVIGGDDLRARRAATRMTVEVHVNGRGPYHFVVDSGADSSIVGVRIAQDLQMPIGTPAILNGTTDRAIVDRVMVDQLALGQTAFTNMELPALQEPNLGGDGLIGIDALVNQRLMMDFEKRVIKVEDARRPEPTEKGAILVVAKRRHGQLILTQVNIGGVMLDAVIDTGSEVTIGNLALRDKLLQRNFNGRHKFATAEAIGVTGKTVVLDLARIPKLQVGPIIFNDVPMAFADVPPFQLFGLSNEPALLLGTDLLENFRRVSLDFRARKVRFQLKRCGTYGIAVSSAPDGFMSKITSDEREACAT